MADAVFYEGDRQPYFRVTLLRGGEAINLENAESVAFKMWRNGREIMPTVVTGAAVVIQTGADTDKGVVEYRWGAADLALYGNFTAAFVISWPTALPETVPDLGYITVLVRPSAT